MDLFLFTGYIGGFCTTLAFFPQVLRTWKRRSARDLSWGLLFLLIIGVFLWIVYGVDKKDMAVTGANFVTECFLVSLAGMKWWFDYRCRG